jgi:hypothetical protein
MLTQQTGWSWDDEWAGRHGFEVEGARWVEVRRNRHCRSPAGRPPAPCAPAPPAAHRTRRPRPRAGPSCRRTRRRQPPARRRCWCRSKVPGAHRHWQWRCTGRSPSLDGRTLYRGSCKLRWAGGALLARKCRRGAPRLAARPAARRKAEAPSLRQQPTAIGAAFDGHRPVLALLALYGSSAVRAL